MFSGAHVVIYSTDSVADRAFFRDVLKLPDVDVGDGWLIFGLPPSEVAFHPARENDRHEFFFLVDDIEELVATLAASGTPCSPIAEEPWGRLVHLTLPGGGKVGVYQPLHERAPRYRSRAD